MSYLVGCGECDYVFGRYEDTQDIPENPECPCARVERVELVAGREAAQRLLEVYGREGLLRGHEEERP